MGIFFTCPHLYSHPVDDPATSSLAQQIDCDNNGVYTDFSRFFHLYQLDREIHQTVSNEIGNTDLLQDLESSYFVGRATLNETVSHLTGRFACLLREYSISNNEKHGVIIDEIEFLVKELSSLLSQLSQLMNLLNAIYSTFNSTITAEAGVIRPSILKIVYLIYEPPSLKFVLQSIGRDLGEKWWISWEGRKVALQSAHLGLSTVQKELSSLDQLLKVIKELKPRIERLPQLLQHGKGWRLTLRQHTLRVIDLLPLQQQEKIKRRVQKTNERSSMLRSWYRDNIVWNLLLQDADLMQSLQPCSWGVQLNCSQYFEAGPNIQSLRSFPLVRLRHFLHEQG